MEDSKRLSIIIVSWNVRQELAQCLESIRQHGPQESCEVFVVDNASSDGTVQMLTENFSFVRILQNQENRGFGAANNQAITECRGKYLLFLNPDTRIHADTLQSLIQFMDDHPDVGACGPKLLNEDGTTQRSVRCFPTFRAVLHRYTALRQFKVFARAYKQWMMMDFAYDTTQDVDQLMGAAILARTRLVRRLGGFDERFFMYFEEVDLCLRIKQLDQRVMFVPSACITHAGCRSAEQVPVKNNIMALTSLLKYLRKHRGRGPTFLFNLIFKPLVILRQVCDIVKGLATMVVSLVTWDVQRREKGWSLVCRGISWLVCHTWRLIFVM